MPTTVTTRREATRLTTRLLAMREEIWRNNKSGRVHTTTTTTAWRHSMAQARLSIPSTPACLLRLQSRPT